MIDYSFINSRLRATTTATGEFWLRYSMRLLHRFVPTETNSDEPSHATFEFKLDHLREGGRGNHDCFAPLDTRSGEYLRVSLSRPGDVDTLERKLHQLQPNAISPRFPVIPLYLANMAWTSRPTYFLFL